MRRTLLQGTAALVAAALAARAGVVFVVIAHQASQLVCIHERKAGILSALRQ